VSSSSLYHSVRLSVIQLLSLIGDPLLIPRSSGMQQFLVTLTGMLLVLSMLLYKDLIAR
jgi:hypothetical protein